MAKLILTREVPGLGDAGDIVDVKNGYARNFLLPRGYALNWTQRGEKQVDALRQARVARESATLEEAQNIAEQLKAATVRLEVKTGDSGRLFGTVKSDDVAAAIAAAGFGTVDKRSIEITDHIKETGSYTAQVKLHPEVRATVNLDVVAAE